MKRREFLASGAAAAGAMLVVSPASAFARTMLRTAAGGATSRTSRLFPDGTVLAHSDLHNHTLFSDGAADPEGAFAQMRAAGLDAASLTDHTVFGSLVQDSVCDACSPFAGIDDVGWARTGELAAANDVPGEFTAIRGFEWTTPHLGHVNVWFSENWVDSFSTGSLADPDALIEFMQDSPNADLNELVSSIAPLLAVLPPTSSIDGFYNWLATPTSGSGLGGGGADALAGFNHPNHYGNFNEFQYFGQAADRIVSCEMMNDRAEYLFVGMAEGMGSPLNNCLNAGWRVGLLGVTDEHGPTFGVLDGQGRAGMWVRELSRDGIREALERRWFYATRHAGLRLDAAANGVRMGGDVAHTSGPLHIEIDIDKSPDWYGKRLLAQILTAGPAGGLPTIARVHEFVVPRPDEALPAFDVDVSVDDTPWAVLRITDPEAPADSLATGDFVGFGDAVAYASTWFLQPGAGVGPSTTAPTATSTLPATGGWQLPAIAGGAASAALIAKWLASAPDLVGHHDHAHDHAHDHDHHHDQ